MVIRGATITVMPTYAYRCRVCSDTFEMNRPMCESDAPTPCPEGHDDTFKLMTAAAVTGVAGASSQSAGGGCCGGGGGCGCGCGGH